MWLKWKYNESVQQVGELMTSLKTKLGNDPWDSAVTKNARGC